MPDYPVPGPGRIKGGKAAGWSRFRPRLCFNVRKLNQALSSRRQAELDAFHGAMHWVSLLLTALPVAWSWGPNLDHLSSDQNGFSNISQALNKSLVTRPVWKNLGRELVASSSPSPSILSERDEDTALSVQSVSNKPRACLSSDSQLSHNSWIWQLTFASVLDWEGRDRRIPGAPWLAAYHSGEHQVL